MSRPPLTDLLRQRYGANDRPGKVAWNATLELLLNHRSVRAYSNERLPDGTLTALVAAAQSAATSSNLQTWSVVAVEDAERKARLSLLADDQEHIRTAPLFLVWLADLSRLARVAEQVGLPALGLDYTELLLVAVIDAALAAQNAVLMAESLGLGTVYIGAMRNRPLDVAAELALPSRVLPVFGLCVGWPDPSSPTAVKPRLPQEAVLHHEHYHQEAEPSAVERYNAAMAAFYREQRMKVKGSWAIHSAKRVAGPESLSGRDKLREALQQLGFLLQ